MKSLFVHCLVLILMFVLCGCAGTFRTDIPAGVTPAVFRVSDNFFTSDIAEILAVNGVQTSSRWSPIPFPRAAELAPGRHLLEVRFTRSSYPPGNRIFLGDRVIPITVQEGRRYRLLWEARSKGFLKDWDLELHVTEEQ